MDYNKIVDYLGSKLEVKESQIKKSFAKTPAFKGINPKGADFTSTLVEPHDFIQSCGGKVPLKMYNLEVVEGRKNRTACIYTSKYSVKGVEKRVVTTSPKKPLNVYRW